MKLPTTIEALRAIRKPVPPPTRVHTTPKGARGYVRNAKHRGKKSE